MRCPSTTRAVNVSGFIVGVRKEPQRFAPHASGAPLLWVVPHDDQRVSECVIDSGVTRAIATIERNLVG